MRDVIQRLITPATELAEQQKEPVYNADFPFFAGFAPAALIMRNLADKVRVRRFGTEWIGLRIGSRDRVVWVEVGKVGVCPWEVRVEHC